MDKPIKILLLTDCLVDPNAGGAERKIYELAQNLDQSKFHVSIATLDCEGTSPQDLIQKLNLNVHVFRVKRIYGLSGFCQGVKFMRFLSRERFDVLQTYHFSSDIWGTFWGRLAGVKTIISNRRDMGFWRKKWHVWAYKLVNPFVSRIVVVSEAVKKEIMKQEKLSSEKITVIYNGVVLSSQGVSSDQRNQVRAQLGFHSEDVIVMHVANFKPVKGHQYLFEALSMIIPRFPQVKLVLIGEDEFNGALQMKAKELNIAGHVLFLGKRDDVRRLLSAADICVLPSLSEGMSNAILEYMDAGKPVVASRVGGNPETVEDGVTGILVEAKNTQSLAKALESLIQAPHVRMNMGINGRQRAEEIFDIRQMFLKYEKLFEESL